DEAAGAAVDRQRRFIAEFDGLDLPRSTCVARPCWVQAGCPLRLWSTMACRNQRRPPAAAQSRPSRCRLARAPSMTGPPDLVIWCEIRRPNAPVSPSNPRFERLKDGL